MNKLLYVILLLISINVYSNDSRMEIGGNLENENSEENFKIINEEINLYIHKKSVDVIVTYLYDNIGDERKLSLGFPIKIKQQKLNKYDAYISNFTHTFNNENIKTQSEYSIENDIDSFYVESTKWLIREVVFPPKQTSKSIIKYSTTLSNAGFENYFGYILGTAITWKSTISQLTIRIFPDKDVIIKEWNIANYNKKYTPDLIALDDEFIIIIVNYDPKSEDEIRLVIEDYNPPISYSNEFGDMYTGWVWDKYSIYNESKNEVLFYRKDQIQLFINLFYAMKGYKFQNKDIQKFIINNESSIFFDNEKQKYIKNDDFNENLFNKVEQDNIDYLRKLMKRLY